MESGRRAGEPGRQQQGVHPALAVSEGRQACAVDLPLAGQEAQRGRGLLLVDLEPDPLGMAGVPTPSRLAAAQLVVAQARDPVGRQPIRHRFKQVSIGLPSAVVVAVGRRAAAPKQQGTRDHPNCPRARMRVSAIDPHPASLKADRLSFPTGSQRRDHARRRGRRHTRLNQGARDQTPGFHPQPDLERLSATDRDHKHHRVRLAARDRGQAKRLHERKRAVDRSSRAVVSEVGLGEVGTSRSVGDREAGRSLQQPASLRSGRGARKRPSARRRRRSSMATSATRQNRRGGERHDAPVPSACSCMTGPHCAPGGLTRTTGTPSVAVCGARIATHPSESTGNDTVAQNSIAPRGSPRISSPKQSSAADTPSNIAISFAALNS